MTKVDLSKQIVILRNIWISTCNIFNSVISFLTERHKRQREIIFKMLIADSNERRNTKKKERKPPRFWVRPGRSNRWWTNILNNKATLEEWRENFRMSEASFYMLCEELRLYLTKQTTKLRKPVSVETEVAVTLYYLRKVNEKSIKFIWFRKGNGFKSHSLCYLCDFRKTWAKVNNSS